LLNASFNKRVLPSRKDKNNKRGNPKGFETVGGFLVSSLPPKKKKAKISDFQEKSLKSQRRLKKSKSEDIYIFKPQTEIDKIKIVRYNTLTIRLRAHPLILSGAK
jgi:phosphatidate phosphatase PAH1|tara:strand:+ start:56145 stop:56459 length:315 start_codon:yes stop_codon:yes gene_type:complete